MLYGQTLFKAARVHSQLCVCCRRPAAEAGGRGLTRDEKAIQHGCQASPHWGNHVLNSFQDYTELTIFARIILLSWKATHRQSKTSIFLWWADTTSPPRHSPSLIQIENEAGCSSSGSRQILEILKNFIIVPIWIFRKMVISDYFVKAGADSRGAEQLSVLPAPPPPPPFLIMELKLALDDDGSIYSIQFIQNCRRNRRVVAASRGCQLLHYSGEELSSC